jgi:hypothetical protein
MPRNIAYLNVSILDLMEKPEALTIFSRIILTTKGRS